MILVFGFCFLASAALLALMYINKTRNNTGAPPNAGAGPVHVQQPPRADDPLGQDPFVVDFFIPPFELRNQDEKVVTNAAFQGKVTVIDFFFTHCPFICPAMTGRFGKLAADFKDHPKVQFLSFSVDPVNDTPERLREYAAQNSADTSRWQFLTGSKEVTWKILTDGLKWGIEEHSEQPITLPGGGSMSNIRHPGWFALIGPDGKVLGIYQHENEAEQIRLAERIHKILRKL